MGTKNLARTVIEGGRASYCKTHYRIENQGERARVRAWLAEWNDEDDWVPTARRKVGRCFSDKLGPARRWLGSHVGKPWDKVYAEMRKRFDTRTTAGRHFVFEHMLPDVDRGDLSGVGRWRRYRFYVDTHGILRKVKS